MLKIRVFYKSERLKLVLASSGAENA